MRAPFTNALVRKAGHVPAFAFLGIRKRPFGALFTNALVSAVPRAPGVGFRLRLNAFRGEFRRFRTGGWPMPPTK